MLFDLLCINGSYVNRRRLGLPMLLGRLHLGLIFSGISGSCGRRTSSEKCTLRSFLFIATVLITKCGSSAFPNRTTAQATVPTEHVHHPSSISSKHLDCCDHQDLPLNHILRNVKTASAEHDLHPNFENNDEMENVKTLGYYLKGLILPMLISLTLSFGFIIFKNRLKRARLQAIQNALEGARNASNPNLPGNGLVTNALLSVLDARGQWNLIPSMEGDDYMGEGGETARHKPYVHDQPPDYAAVFDPPSYEEATMGGPIATSSDWKFKVSLEQQSLMASGTVESTSLHFDSINANGFNVDEDGDDDGDEKQLVRHSIQ